MKRFIVFAMLTMAAAGVAAQIIPPAIKGQDTTVKGEIVDLYCYMRGGFHGAGHKTCSTKCATQGNPIGFVDEKGGIYTLAGRADYQATHDVRDELIKRMNETVVLGGTVVKKGSTQLLYVNTVDGKAVEPKP